MFLWALSAVVARFVHIEEVTGSIPVVPTRQEMSNFSCRKYRLARQK